MLGKTGYAARGVGYAEVASPKHGIDNLVGGWGCRGLPNNGRLKRSAVTLHCPELRLTDTLV